MKKNLGRILMLIMIILFVGCSSKIDKEFIQIVVSQKDDNSMKYLTVYDSGETKKTEKILFDENEIYVAENDAFSSEIKNNKVENILQDTNLIDQNGKNVKANTLMTELMQKVADEIKHDIFEFKIIKVKEKYFAVVQLNVNWQDPCQLYYYDQERKTLNKLYESDNVDIIGIGIQ